MLLTTGCRDTFDNKHWNRARASVELPDGFDFHDLRHTALTLTGLVPDATVADLMRRGGHGSAEAGMRDRHSTDDNDRRIAERMNAMLLEAKARAIDAPCADETWIDNEPGAADADA